MEIFLPVERALWVATLFAEALLFVRLIREGLIPSYPFFAAFLAADVICSVVLMQVDILSRNYSEAFRACTLFMTIFRLGMTAELYERICQHFPGIGRFRVGLAAVLVLLAALVTIFTLRPSLVNQWAFPQTIVVIQRFQNEIVVAALVLTWIFLRFVLSIRQPFRPNTITHWRLSTIYFGASGAAYLATLLTGGGTAVFRINSAMLAVQLGCFFAWFHLMRRSGEELPAFHRLSPDQVQSVENYNRELLRTVRSLRG